MSTLASLSPSRTRSRVGRAPIVIGLINNMPDAALLTTERQFGDLIAGANQPVELKFYALTSVTRSAASSAHIAENYEDIDGLWEGGVDGLIVTGTQPRYANFVDEPYWTSLTQLVDWAKHNTISTIWSCLAAHAAVLHLDTIARRPFAEKLSGVFDCAKTIEHPLTAGLPDLWPVPHSRYNDIPRDELLARGYTILSHSPDAGVDTFVKQDDSLFLFFQGHPEYDPGTLQREYRADIVRFLSGERATYPNPPRNYFCDKLLAELANFRAEAEANRLVDMIASFPISKTQPMPAHDWRSCAQRIYANWLDYVASRKPEIAGNLAVVAVDAAGA